MREKKGQSDAMQAIQSQNASPHVPFNVFVTPLWLIVAWAQQRKRTRRRERVMVLVLVPFVRCGVASKQNYDVTTTRRKCTRFYASKYANLTPPTSKYANFWPRRNLVHFLRSKYAIFRTKFAPYVLAQSYASKYGQQPE